jgi:tetratricopeptide (TPR) repeat protein
MTFLNRLKWVSTGLAIAGAITTAAVWGDVTRPTPAKPAAAANKLFSDEVVGKFTHRPAVAYQALDGGVYFAIQVKPELQAAANRPRDIQILIDHSASQAGAPLDAARKIAKEIVAVAGESDRVAVWAVSTPRATRNLNRGGGLKSAADARAAFGPLENEYASGAVDLKDAIDRAAKEFDGKATRQQVILYLGDGESALNPLDEATRYKLATDLHSQNIAFYAIPLGTPINGHNIHTLVSGTGGTVLRASEEKTEDPVAAIKGLAVRFQKSLSVPVMEPAKATLSAEVAEMYPAKLPPLRADEPTLVVGRFEKGKVPASLELTIEGKVVGAATTVKVTQPMPEPAADNFFLGSVVAQWRNSGHADAPAILRADRTLALAYEGTRLTREEFLEQANWAVGAKKLDAAKSLFNAALKLDPLDPRGKAGAKLVEKLEKGEVSLEELRKASFNTANGVHVDVDQLVQDKKDAPKAPPEPVNPPKAGPAPADVNALLRQAEAQQRIREQQVTVAVDETLARARALLNAGDPRSAKDLLVSQRDTIRVAGDISEGSRNKLLNRVELLLQDVGTRGDAMIRARAEENEKIARAHQRLVTQDQEAARQERIRDRIKTFDALMNQARYEDAYREALVMENELLNAGYGSPGATFAVGRIGQAASNYRDFRELVRLREDRYLLAMMEVEKSHMPYPDEPAVHFPPAKIWRELTQRRREYSGTDFDKDMTPRQKQRYQMLQNSLIQTLDLRELKGGGDFAFGSLLTDIQRLVSIRMKRDVTIYINYSTFPQEARQTLRDAKVNLNALMDATGENLLREITFKTLLDTLCRQVGASFWVTPDYIEIVEIEKAATSRVFKVLAVEDLIIPVPNAVNQLALQQSLQVLGQQFSLAGGNAFGALGAFGGGFIGNFGGQQQQQGGGGFNGQAGQLFNGGQPGGGALGFGGGNVGQFGNLGGQFGFQGGRQSKDPATELVVLIQTVVDPGYWDPDVSFLSRNLLTGDNRDDPAGEMTQVEAKLRNKMMYNLTTRSLVVYGRSRFHRSTPGRPLTKDEVGAAGAANPEGRGIAKGPDGKGPDGKGPDQVVKAPVKGGELISTRKPANPVDAERMWKQVIDQGVRDPMLVVACAEFLAECKEFKHAAELLKASLRSGLTPERWYQEALAIALEESQGSPEEIERAYVSAIDLEPKNPQTYLQVAKSLNALGNPDAAVRLCKVAAKLEPNTPDAYASALVYAENPKATASYDVAQFAAGGLLARDWPYDNGSLHASARNHLLEAVRKLDAANRKADAEKVEAMLAADKNRDLVIEMSWAGPAELGMRVKEPIGTLCSCVNPMTTGGGALREGVFDPKEDSRSEVYTAAQAFNGTYTIAVDRIWGRSQGEKAQVKVTQHQGTPDERVDYYTVDVSRDTELKVAVEGGRRTDIAVLPSPVDRAKYRTKTNDASQVMNKLRTLISGTGNLSGGVGSTANSVMKDAAVGGSSTRSGEVTWSTRLGAERSVGLDIRSETTVRPDGKVEVKAIPVFDSLPKDARAHLDLIPGGE